jgi:hypothetical protein
MSRVAWSSLARPRAHKSLFEARRAVVKIGPSASTAEPALLGADGARVAQSCYSVGSDLQ